MACAGRAKEGLEVVDLAIRLSPRDPRTFWIVGLKGHVHVVLEQYGEGEQFIRRSLGLNDKLFWAWIIYAIASAMQSKTVEASVALSELSRVAPDFKLEDMAKIYKNWHIGPAGERNELVDSWIDSLRDIWPS